MKPEDNPFFFKYYDGRPTFVSDAADRLDLVRGFNADQCRAALSNSEFPLQKGVHLAIERRLRKLEKGRK